MAPVASARTLAVPVAYVHQNGPGKLTVDTATRQSDILQAAVGELRRPAPAIYECRNATSFLIVAAGGALSLVTAASEMTSSNPARSMILM